MQKAVILSTLLVTTTFTITNPSATPAAPASAPAPASPQAETPIAQNFQPETYSTAPTWTTETTPSHAPTWQIESPQTHPTNFAQQPPNFGNANPAPGNPEPDAPTPATPTPETLASPEAIQTLEDQLKSYQAAPKSITDPYRASPGITLANPSGFGADRNRTFVGLGLQRTRLNTNDGAAGIGIGLGNAQTGVGVQISYTSSSISPGKLFSNLNGIAASTRPFGSGGFNLKIHHQFPDGLSIALGADSIINIGPKGQSLIDPNLQNEFQGTYYAVATQFIKLKPDADESFSRLALTVGAGTGRFQPTQTQIDQQTVITPFASAALKISPAASFITEWSGQDFGVALSWVPLRNLPIVLTPAIRDLFGPDATSPRFVLGIGLSL